MNRQIINEEMRVELGIWPIFTFLFNPAFWAGVGQVAVTGTQVASAGMTVDSIVKSFNRPEGNPVSIPGVEAARGLSPAVATALQRQRTELEALQQEGLKRQEELKKVETQTAIKQKTQNILSKYGPFLAAGGVALLIVLVVRKRRKK